MPNHSVARLNDTGSHNGADRGTIITSAKRTYLNKSLPARVGDTYVCPKHGVNAIRTGSSKVWVESRRLARVGSKTWCGATIDSGAHNVTDGSAETDPFLAPPGAFDVSCVVESMINEGWTHGARLMIEWMTRTANGDVATAKPNTDIVTMDWVLSYPRANEVYQNIFAEKIWMNEPAKALICKKLADDGLFNGSPSNFGTLALPAPELAPRHIQSRTVGYKWFEIADRLPPDDLQAALADFELKMVVSGEVRPAEGGRNEVKIGAVGVFAEDQYEFGDSLAAPFQYLGSWSCSERRFSLLGTPIFNSDFRRWRKLAGLGSDYMVYSDVKITDLDPDHNSFIC